jgi:hypothetical protein
MSDISTGRPTRQQDIMDKMARALGLGGTTEADDELRPNDNESVTQGQTVMAPAAADNSWNILMAAQ